jgi:hypothetical protein
LAITLALLVGVNLLTAFAPTVVIVAAGPLIAAALVGLAHWVGLTWHDLGLSRRTWRRGAAYGGVAVALVAAVYLVGILLPPTRQAFLDVRYDIALGSALLTALVFIPLKTVLVEEIAFRGVLLERGLELLAMLKEDMSRMGAEDLHQLQRVWELHHRLIASESVTRHTLFREETRWPGYYYRGDAMKVDDANWHVLTVSRRDPKTGEYTMEKAPCYHLVTDGEVTTSSHAGEHKLPA